MLLNEHDPEDVASSSESTTTPELSYEEVLRNIKSIEDKLLNSTSNQETLELSLQAIEAYKKVPLSEREQHGLELIRGLAKHHFQAAQSAFTLHQIDLSRNHCEEAIEFLSEIPDQAFVINGETFSLDEDNKQIPTYVKSNADISLLQQCKAFLENLPLSSKPDYEILLDKGIKWLDQGNPDDALISLLESNEKWLIHHPDSKYHNTSEAKRFFQALHYNLGLVNINHKIYDEAHENLILSLVNAMTLHEDKPTEYKDAIIETCKILCLPVFNSSQVFDFIIASINGNFNFPIEAISSLVNSFDGLTLDAQLIIARDLSIGLQLIKSFTYAYGSENSPFRKWLENSRNLELLEMCLSDNGEKYTEIKKNKAIDRASVIISMLSDLKRVFYHPRNIASSSRADEDKFEEKQLSDILSFSDKETLFEESLNHERKELISDVDRRISPISKCMANREYNEALNKIGLTYTLIEQIPSSTDTVDDELTRLIIFFKKIEADANRGLKKIDAEILCHSTIVELYARIPEAVKKQKDYYFQTIHILECLKHIPSADTRKIFISLQNALLVIGKYTHKLEERGKIEAFIQLKLGLIYFDAENYRLSLICLESGLKALNQVFDSNTNDSSILNIYINLYYNLGKTYFNLNRKMEAYESLTNALSSIIHDIDQLNEKMLLDIFDMLQNHSSVSKYVFQFAHRVFSNDKTLSPKDLSRVINVISTLPGAHQMLHIEELMAVLELMESSVSNRVEPTKFNEWLSGEIILELDAKLEQISNLYEEATRKNKEMDIRETTVLASRILSILRPIAIAPTLLASASKALHQNSALQKGYKQEENESSPGIIFKLSP